MKDIKFILELAAAIVLFFILVAEPVEGSFLDNALILIISKVFAGGSLLIIGNSMVSLLKRK